MTKINLPVDFPLDISIRLNPDSDSYFVAGISGSRLGSVKLEKFGTGQVAFSDRSSYLAVINLDGGTPSISIYVKTVP